LAGTGSAGLRNMRLFAAVFCLLTVTGCYRDSPTSPGPIDQRVTLAPGVSTTVDAAGVSLKFIGVSGDSRCPGDAICIQGGSATVRVEVTNTSGARQDVTFETGNLQPVSYATLTLELVELAPYPFGSRPPIQPQDYRATVRIKR
jgi:hypothetical protein